MDTPNTAEFAHIGKSVVIKGELSGSEDLYVDGQVEGTIELHGNNLIIGPTGQVRANVNAKGVVVEGKLDGNIHASERTELKKSAIAVGDIITQRVAIEDGAYYKGKVDMQKDSARPDLSKPQGRGVPTPVSSASGAAASAAGTSAAALKTPVTETK